MAKAANNGQPAMLTRDLIAAAPDITTEIVEVPEWGGAVQVRALTGAQRDSWESSVVRMEGDKRIFNMADLRARFVQLCVVNADGDLLFGPSDIEWLTGKSARALDRIFRAGQRLSGMTEQDLQEMEANLGRAAPGN